jgi:hypothetical protein
MMDGQRLYLMWVEELAKQGCSSDSWDDLEEMDRLAWNGLAERLTNLGAR